VLHLRLIILLEGGDIPIDNDTLLVIDFMNLKIKSTQSFRGAHMNRMCVYIHIDDYLYMYKYLYFNIFLK
jgi:hypothetical protein